MEARGEAAYTHLQGKPVEYQTLKPPVYLEVLDSPIFPPRPGLPPPPGCSIEQQDDCGYTFPQIQSSKDILDSVAWPLPLALHRNTLARTASGVYEEIPDDLAGEDVYNDGYLHPVSQPLDIPVSSPLTPDGDNKSPDVPASPPLTPDSDNKSLDDPERESYVAIV